MKLRIPETEPAELRDQLLGESSFAKRIADQENHAVLDELPGGLADHQFLFSELRIDVEVVYTGETGHTGSVATRGRFRRSCGLRAPEA